MLRPVYLDPSRIGQDLPWDVYTESGVLVAGAGLVVADAEHFHRLTARPLFREGVPGVEDDSPLLRLSALAGQIEGKLKLPQEDAIRTLARELLVLLHADADACLGYASLVPLARPCLGHALRVLFTAGLLAEELDFSEAEQESLAASALTMNFATPDLHDRLHEYGGELSASERMELHAHPQASADLLVRVGVDDAIWLDAVRQHHENLDGSGYPARLFADEISVAARLLRVVDFYCVKISGRNYLPPRSTIDAFQSLFGREKSRLDRKIATLLLRRLGIYPPGTLVRLANHEIACITRHGTRWAVSVLDARERVLDPPQARELNAHNHAIIGTAERRSRWPAINWMAVWGY